jgi:hypothetical protein
MSTVLLDGFIIKTASNSLEAVTAAYERRPAGIVMDDTGTRWPGGNAIVKAIDAIRDARVIADRNRRETT